jgi:hypothetical protein
MNPKREPPRYREIQRWSDVWLVMVLVTAVAAVQWWGFIQQVILGQSLGLGRASEWLMIGMWLVFGVGLPLLAYWLRMVVEVYPDRIIITYRPLSARTVLMLNVVSVEPRVYGQVPGIANWGARSEDNSQTFNISAPTAVQVMLRDRTRLLIGTHTPDRLAAAIAAARYDVKK